MQKKKKLYDFINKRGAFAPCIRCEFNISLICSILKILIMNIANFDGFFFVSYVIGDRITLMN